MDFIRKEKCASHFVRLRRMICLPLLITCWATLTIAQTSPTTCAPPVEADSKLDELRGRVKSVRTFKSWFRKDQQTGRLIQEKPELEEEARYDAKGNQINLSNVNYLPVDPNDELTVHYVCDGFNRLKEIRYGPAKGPSFKKTLYSYDEQGRKTDQADYLADGTLETLQTYVYDDKGNVREEILKEYIQPEHFIPKKYGVYVTTKTIFGYDSKRHKTSETEYSPDGSIYSTSLFVYDSSANVIKETHRDKLGRLKDQFFYKYDQKNRLIEEKNYANFCYDRNGELCKGVLDSGDGLFYYLTRIVYKYDRKGNWISQRQFSSGGETGSQSYEADYIMVRRITYW